MESNEKIICEFELNRGWVYGNGPDEDATGEKNFVISAEYLHEIFPKLFPDKTDLNLFLETYEPETEGEKIYRQALLDDAVIEEFETDRRNDDES